MEIVIDFALVPTHNPIAFGWWFFVNIGWIFPAFLFIYGLVLTWQNYIRNNYRKTRKYILLSIDVPKDNEQSPLAIENLFSHLAGAHQPLRRYQKWWDGEINDSFSFEIVSLGGYIQFIIHTVDKYRDLIEAIIYAQYPDAEINEVQDYTKKWKLKFPNEKYELFGTEVKLAKNDVYPIITYKEFEDSLSQELKDPMASILESLTRIGPKEEIWIQYVVTPADNDWGEKARPIIDKLVGSTKKQKKSFVDFIFDLPNIFLDALNPTPATESAPQKEPLTQMLHLTPGQKDAIAAIEHKVNKLGFHVKIRYIYLGEKEAFIKQRGVQGVYGSFKQFNDLGLNSFKPDPLTMTGGVVWFKKLRLKWRKNRILMRFKDRAQSLSPGEYGKILNTEELASLWHFPVLTVKAPLVAKTRAKKAEPPSSLPIERPQLTSSQAEQSPASKASPPEGLPTE